jgi:hypothetical protein
MLTATTEVEAPLSVAAYTYITPSGYTSRRVRVGRPKLAEL